MTQSFGLSDLSFFKVDNHCGNSIDHFRVSYVEAILRISFSICKGSEFSIMLTDLFGWRKFVCRKFVIEKSARSAVNSSTEP